jgi:TrmH family RNA methyltransferase
MLSKSEIKDIQSLSHKKFRKALKLFVAEGPKIVGELVQLTPGRIERIYALKEWIEKSPDLDKLNVTQVSEAELEKISDLKTPNQVVAVIKQFEEKEFDASSFTLYLDTIQDPGNLGTIIRTADWFGVKQVVCSKDCADLYNPKLIQATMASIARVSVYYDEANNWLQKQKVPVYAATLDGDSLYDQPKKMNGVLIIGNESKGISAGVLALATQKITIPQKGDAESLNAAVAAGVILTHLVG